MLNIFGPIKKIIGFDKKATNPLESTNTKDDIINKVQQIPGFVSKKIEEAVTEYGIIREKMKDLSTTNYNLGMKHLENGRISEAIFRFKLLKKFWPENYEAYYQLAYCLILEEKFDKAEEIITELLQKNSDYEDRVMVLLSSIDNAKKKKAESENLNDNVN
jgi:tetratricopeptide (TPR) repeat protein